MMAITPKPTIRYFYCNEILRDVFYYGRRWDLNMVETHSLFFRNTGNPIKGLPGMLRALSILVKRYPDIKLYIVGTAIYKPSNMKQRFVEGTYNRECREIMDKNDLWKHIEFLQSLNSKQMKERYLKSHAVISASNIENESNVVSEAKILGVPVVLRLWEGCQIVLNTDMMAFCISLIYQKCWHIILE